MNFRRRPAGVSFYLRDSSHRYRSILRIGLFLALLVVAPARLTAQWVGSTPTPAMPAQRRLIRPTLPPSASQADAGAQVYTLVCSACHGDLGQGLTDEWRATWNPSDQNCWQSKCHGLNRPSDGFDLPRYVPPVVGPAVLGRFRTALDLFGFIRQVMPWQEPASLQEEEYWDVTAFVVQLNGVDPGPDRLDSQRAAGLLLNPSLTLSQTVVQATPTPPRSPLAFIREESGRSMSISWLIAIALFIGCAVTLVAMRRRRVARRVGSEANWDGMNE